jgi:hypothetical protein
MLTACACRRVPQHSPVARSRHTLSQRRPSGLWMIDMYQYSSLTTPSAAAKPPPSGHKTALSKAARARRPCFWRRLCRSRLPGVLSGKNILESKQTDVPLPHVVYSSTIACPIVLDYQAVTQFISTVRPMLPAGIHPDGDCALMVSPGTMQPVVVSERQPSCPAVCSGQSDLGGLLHCERGHVCSYRSCAPWPRPQSVQVQWYFDDMGLSSATHSSNCDTPRLFKPLLHRASSTVLRYPNCTSHASRISTVVLFIYFYDSCISFRNMPHGRIYYTVSSTVSNQRADSNYACAWDGSTGRPSSGRLCYLTAAIDCRIAYCRRLYDDRTATRGAKYRDELISPHISSVSTGSLTSNYLPYCTSRYNVTDSGCCWLHQAAYPSRPPNVQDQFLGG